MSSGWSVDAAFSVPVSVLVSAPAPAPVLVLVPVPASDGSTASTVAVLWHAGTDGGRDGGSGGGGGGGGRTGGVVCLAVVTDFFKAGGSEAGSTQPPSLTVSTSLAVLMCSHGMNDTP